MSRYHGDASDNHSYRSRRQSARRSYPPSEDSYFDDRRSHRSERTQRSRHDRPKRDDRRGGRNANNDSGRGATGGKGGSKYDTLGKASLFIGFLEITVGLLQLWTTKKSADRDQQNQRQQEQEFEDRKRQRRREEGRREREQRRRDEDYADDVPSELRSIGYYDGYEEGASRTSRARGRIEGPPGRARSRARSEGGRSRGERSEWDEEEDDSGYDTPSRYDPELEGDRRPRRR